MVLTTVAAEVFRDYSLDGVPASGAHEPRKSDIRRLIGGIEQVVNAFTSAGGLIYDTRALLEADLAKSANSMAWVIADSTAANNGVYKKLGASGAGSWVRVADLPYSFIVATDVGAGTANAIQATSLLPISTSALVLLNIFETNTGTPVTVSFNGGGPLTIKSNSGNNVAPGGLPGGMLVMGRVSGAEFRIVTDQVSSAIVAAAEAAQTAAAASASAAANSASAAAESAAGVSLPAIAANRMLVDNPDGTARESKTFAQVNDLLEKSTWAFDNNTLYKSRSNKDRWLDSYKLAEELNFSGATLGTNATVLTALFNRLKASGRSEIHLPAGDIRLEAGASVTLNNPDGTHPVRIIGQGGDVTRFMCSAADQRAITIGDDALNYTYGLTLEGFGFADTVAQNDNGSRIFVLKTSGLRLADINFGSCRNALSLGVAHTAAPNNVVYTFMEGCGAESMAGNSGSPMIRLGSGAVLRITPGGRRWNGAYNPTTGANTHDFIRHDNNAQNWDGLYVYGQFLEAFSKNVYSSGKGIVNLEWTGGQVDRSAIGWHCDSLVATGSNRNWMIHHTQILGGPSFAGYGCLFQPGASTDSRALENMRVLHNNFENHRFNAVYMVNACGRVEGNTFDNCAYDGGAGGAIVRVGQPSGARGYANVANNEGFRHPSSPGAGAVNGILWDGASSARRSSGNNVWLDLTGSAESGTR
jgi:hypothetical protein